MVTFYQPRVRALLGWTRGGRGVFETEHPPGAGGFVAFITTIEQTAWMRSLAHRPSIIASVVGACLVLVGLCLAPSAARAASSGSLTVNLAQSTVTATASEDQSAGWYAYGATVPATSGCPASSGGTSPGAGPLWVSSFQYAPGTVSAVVSIPSQFYAGTVDMCLYVSGGSTSGTTDTLVAQTTNYTAPRRAPPSRWARATGWARGKYQPPKRFATPWAYAHGSRSPVRNRLRRRAFLGSAPPLRVFG